MRARLWLTRVNYFKYRAGLSNSQESFPVPCPRNLSDMLPRSATGEHEDTIAAGIALHIGMPMRCL